MLSSGQLQYDSGLTLYEGFSLPPRAIIDQKQIGFLLAQGPFFCTPLLLMRASSQRLIAIQKKRNQMVALCFAFVIRLGFEPKTHSLEGCCSIQLSYRTDP